MLSKIRVFPITSYGTDGYPVLGTPIKLVSLSTGETEVNNISVKITPTVKTKTLNADDIEEIHNSIVGLSGEIEAYGIDATALANITEAEKDSNNNINHVVNTGSEKHVCLFFQGKNEKGAAFQKWLYKAKFDPIEESNKTSGDSAEAIKLTFTASVIVTGTTQRTHATVYEGNTGYISGEPGANDIYKQPAPPSNP